MLVCRFAPICLLPVRTKWKGTVSFHNAHYPHAGSCARERSSDYEENPTICLFSLFQGVVNVEEASKMIEGRGGNSRLLPPAALDSRTRRAVHSRTALMTPRTTPFTAFHPPKNTPCHPPAGKKMGDLVSKYGLGDPIAGTIFEAQWSDYYCLPSLLPFHINLTCHPPPPCGLLTSTLTHVHQ